MGGDGPAPSAVCAALLRQLTGLRSLHLWNGEREVSPEALQQLSCLSQGALTSLHVYRMHNAGNEVLLGLQGGAAEVAATGGTLPHSVLRVRQCSGSGAVQCGACQRLVQPA